MRDIVEELRIQSYKSALHCIDEIVLFYADDGKIVNWNMQTVSELFYDKDDMSRITMQDLFSKQAAMFFEKGKQDARGKAVQMPVYRKNGTCFPAEVKHFIIGNEYAFGICIIKNIEELLLQQEKNRSLQEELNQARSAKDSFLANVTHELRTPLNGMKGMANLLLSGNLDSSQVDTVKTMMNCFDTMEKIVTDILDYSKLAAGKMEIEEHPFAFYPWVEDVMKVHRGLIENKNIAFESNVDSTIPSHLIGDSYHLTQVINNLFTNAIKFTTQGRIVFDIAVQSNVGNQWELLFSITDTGIGISKEKKEELFQSFVQGDPSITRKYGGTGLGLSICKKLVSLMGGTIQAESELHKGSRFYFTVPLTADTAIVEEKEPEVEKPHVIHEETKSLSLIKLMEQLALCIDFESYEKAEKIVHMIKDMTKGEQNEISKKAFRLELALRKSDTNKIKTQYLELCRTCNL
ncbi:MAG: ATP-binding protein [bacterium]|nr:ATP-binding protein [bacterium]